MNALLEHLEHSPELNTLAQRQRFRAKMDNWRTRACATLHERQPTRGSSSRWRTELAGWPQSAGGIQVSVPDSQPRACPL